MNVRAPTRREPSARFDDKIVLIFGGNSGIGLAAAQAFAGEGARVTITGRNGDTIAQAQVASGAVLALKSDMADLAATAQAVATVEARFGRIDVLFVNAGVGGISPVREITAEFWDNIHSIDLRGAFFAAQQSLRLMHRGGSILFTGSVGGSMAVPGSAAYAAAKAGLRAASRALALELLGDGIRVNMISPGPIETPIMSRGSGPGQAEDDFRAAINRNLPIGRMGSADEVAGPVLCK